MRYKGTITAAAIVLLAATPTAASTPTEPANNQNEDVVITTVAGTGEAGQTGDGEAGISAKLAGPDAVTAAPDGTVYVADGSRTVRAIQPDGTITAVAGTGESGFSGDGGPATEAAFGGGDEFWSAGGMDVGPDGTLYVADMFNHRVRAVAPDGTIRTVAGSGPTVDDVDYIVDASTHGEFSGDGGPAAEARLSNPNDVAVGPDGTVYIADTWNYRIRAVDEDGVISTVAGAPPGDDGADLFPKPDNDEDGALATETFVDPNAVTVDSDGTIYFLERDDQRVRAIDPETDEVSTVFDDRLLPALDTAVDLAMSDDGTFLVSSYESAAYAVDPADGTVETFGGGDSLGDGGPPDQASLAHPLGIDVGPDGEVYIADTQQNRVRKVAPEQPSDDVDVPGHGDVVTFAGSGTPVGDSEDDDTGNWLFGDPYSLDIDLTSPHGVESGSDGTVYIADTGNNRIRSVNLDDGRVQVVAGTGEVGTGEAGDSAADASIVPVALAISDEVLYFIDDDQSRIRVVDLADGTIDTPPGIVDDPRDIDVADDGTLYVATGDEICAIEQDTTECATIIGEDADTKLIRPEGVAVADDGTVYVADTGNARVRAVDPDDGSVSLFAGNGELTITGDDGPAVSAGIGLPSQIDVGPDGMVYVVATGSHVVRAVDPESGVISSVAGALPEETAEGGTNPVPSEQALCDRPELAGDFGGDGGPAAEATLNRPQDVAATPDGQVYVADTCNNRIRAVGGDVEAPERGVNVRPWLILGIPLAVVIVVGVFFIRRRWRAS